MTGDLRAIPYDELDRHHQQARVCLAEALATGDEAAYRRADAFETRVRHEKIRRARERAHTDAEAVAAPMGARP